MTVSRIIHTVGAVLDPYNFRREGNQAVVGVTVGNAGSVFKVKGKPGVVADSADNSTARLGNVHPALSVPQKNQAAGIVMATGGFQANAWLDGPVQSVFRHGATNGIRDGLHDVVDVEGTLSRSNMVKLCISPFSMIYDAHCRLTNVYVSRTPNSIWS